MPRFRQPMQHPLALPLVAPFARVDVTNIIAGGTQVQWSLRSAFCEQEPYTFQLQYAESSVPGANWTDVGAPVVDAYLATDPTKRNFGKELTAYYRVRLTTDLGNVYVSEPVPVEGGLSATEWGYAREIVRKEKLNQRRVAIEGWLFKAKRAGTPCPTCLDADLGQVTDSRCPTCYGMRIQGGYYAAVEHHAALQPNEHELKRNLQKGPMDEPWVVPARMLASPYPAREDVWVNKRSDERYLVRKVRNLAELRGVPVVVEVTLNLAPFDDVIYGLTRPS